jgi:hypothetical protein
MEDGGAILRDTWRGGSSRERGARLRSGARTMQPPRFRFSHGTLGRDGDGAVGGGNGMAGGARVVASRFR